MSRKQLISQLFTPSLPKSSSHLIDKEENLAFDPLPDYKTDDLQYNQLLSDFKGDGRKQEAEILYEGEKISREKINENLDRAPKIRKKKVNKEDVKANKKITDEKMKKTKKIKKEKVVELENLESNEGKKNISKVKKIKKVSKAEIKPSKNSVLSQDLNGFLEEIEKEDLKAENQQMTTSLSEIEKSKIVALQLKLESFLCNIRMKLQPVLESAKIMPKSFIYHLQGKEEKEKNFALQLMILSVLDGLELEKEGNSKYLKELLPYINEIKDDVDEHEIDLDLLFEEEKKKFDSQTFFLEETLTKWSQKTQLMTPSLAKSNLHHLMHTPLGQVNKMMEGIDRLIMKSQLKRKTCRILGEGLENLNKDFDEEIFDDGDLYVEVVKKKIEEDEEEGTEGGLFGTTRRYLEERKIREGEKKKKDVDRRASKARKLRYDVHHKLINFMQSIENASLIDGRDEVIGDLRRKWNGKQDEVTSVKPKKKKNKEPIEEMDVPLI